MKSKKKPAKPTKKPVKKAAVVAKKPVKKAVAVTSKKISKKSAPAKKTVSKSAATGAGKKTAFSLKSAASQLKRVFTGAESKSAKKPAAPAARKSSLPAASAGKTSAVAAKIAAVTTVPMPKGLLTEDRIRKMSDKDYMNDAQLSFFRYRLLQMRSEVLAREVDVKERLHQREVFADPADRATAEEEHWLDLRLRERESLLLRKIDDALRRIADREFGYCEKTGDPIGIPRLLARPTATVCVDVKGQDERIESQFRDR